MTLVLADLGDEMDNGNRDIPTWVGRAVTTEEFSQVSTDDQSKFDASNDSLASGGVFQEVSGPESALAAPHLNEAVPQDAIAVALPSETLPGHSNDSSNVPFNTPDSYRPESVPAEVGRRRWPYALVGVLGLVGVLAAGSTQGWFGSVGEGESVSSEVASEALEADPESASLEEPTSSSESTGLDNETTETPDSQASDLGEETADPQDSTSTDNSDAAGESAAEEEPTGVGANAAPLPDQTLARHKAEAFAAGQESFGVVVGGKLYLYGRVPSQDAAAELTRRVNTVVGETNVVHNYEIDPSASADDPPLYIKMTVFFEDESDEIPPGSTILAVAGIMLGQYPGTELDVVAHTGDADADEVDLATRRVNSIRDHLVEDGVDASRVEANVRSDVVANVETGNLPIEFAVTGLLN